jgi:hypothetical protein
MDPQAMHAAMLAQEQEIARLSELVRMHELALNRRAEVEQLLLNVAKGKRGLLSQEECRVLAFRLGDPTSKPITPRG